MSIARMNGKPLYGSTDKRKEMILAGNSEVVCKRGRKKMAETKCYYFKEGHCCCGHSKTHGMNVSGTVNYPPCNTCDNFRPKKEDRKPPRKD